jgi:prevent-host-death family protein
MTHVGVKELKNRLSHFLRLARAGARIQVTDHGRPVAEIGPVPAARSADRLQRVLTEAAALGQVRLPRGGGVGRIRPIRLKGGATLSDAVIEDRR